MNKPNYNLDEIKDEFIWRLAKEHLLLHDLVQANRNLLEYTVMKNSRQYPSPPVEYKVTYKFKSIVRLDDVLMPVYDDEHEMKIRVPRGYPLQVAECKMMTDTWHPNIKASGPYKGTICTNHKEGGSLFYLEELVVRIGEYLQYKKYLAENVPPFPEDQEVAKWVREIAEPQGIVDKKKNNYVDDTSWKYVQIATEEEENDDDIIIEIDEISNTEKPLGPADFIID